MRTGKRMNGLMNLPKTKEFHIIIIIIIKEIHNINTIKSMPLCNRSVVPIAHVLLKLEITHIIFSVKSSNINMKR